MVMNDCELYNNASVETIKSHFEDFLGTSDMTTLCRFTIAMRLCLFIDDEVLGWLRAAPSEPPLPANYNQAKVWMKAIETTNVGMIFERDDDEEDDKKFSIQGTMVGHWYLCSS